MNFTDSKQNILPHNGEVYMHSLFNSSESDYYFKNLLNEVPWKHEAIQLFGKQVLQPRLTAWYADEGKSYTYSGITMQGAEWTKTLLSVKSKVEKITGYSFNSALLNYYRDGKDSMGWHRDTEKELGLNPIIASVSFGCTRTFKLRDYQSKRDTISIDLQHGNLMLMKGETQHYWEHSLPKSFKISEGRINLTFRSILQQKN